MPVSPPLSSPLDLVLHIGSGKTGTSSIQYFLRQNRVRLAELGLLYPQSPGRRRHTHLSLSVYPDHALDDNPSWDPERWSSPEEFRRAFRRRLFREINQSGLSRVLLSDEGLYGSPNQALRRLRRFTDRIAGSLRLVVYLRRQDDHLVSRYQQVVKIGETRRLADRAPHENTSWAGRQGSRTYDYYDRLRTWQNLLEPDDFVVRHFERESFVEGSLYQDFFDAVGLDARADELDRVETVNESLDAESVEFLRILNIFRLEHADAAVLPRRNRPLVVRLAAACTGPTLTMPDAFLDEFMAQWEEPNRRLAREMLGDESGELFRTARKTHNTTSEQYLDPARLDHFLTLLELPEQIHASLRQLVEREAKAR
jgi:hypothetical protein